MKPTDCRAERDAESVEKLKENALEKRAKLREFVASVHKDRYADLEALKSDPAVVRSIQAISGQRVSGVHFIRNSKVHIAD